MTKQVSYSPSVNLQYVFEGCGKELSFPIGNKFGLFHYCVGGGFKRRKEEERSWLAHGVQHTPMGGHLVKVQLPVLSATYVCFIPNSFSLVTQICYFYSAGFDVF